MGEFFSALFNNLKILRIRDFIDVAIVAYVIYKGIKLIKETRASQLIKGIFILVAFMYISGVLQFNTINFILENTLQIGLIAILIVFQPELRRALEKVGNTSISKIIKINDDAPESDIDDVFTAVSKLAKTKTGALILIERNTKLGDIMASGTIVDSHISEALLVNLFVPNTPLHDGAVVIGDNRIKAAACFLPLTENTSFSKELGTRHRAAIGVSEVADCIAIVVSEETGTISMALNGNIKRDYTPATLKREVAEILESDKPSEGKKKSKREKIFPWVVNKK
ncbi:MAG: TIGR00159 family protein [Ruminococcaceae bacterium]|nr:TIGR00159 family protein [Oscillospiraceae bacterium]